MTQSLTVGCLFDGIHGFGLGLAQAGPFRVEWTVEYADFPHGILEQRIPHATHYRDVREVRNPPPVDVLTGGFPCQDLSLAGRGAGIGGTRSGLWGEYARIIGEVRPRLVLIENVPALLHRGFEVVLGDLKRLGYAAEWDCLPAAAFGAPHLRDRVWVAAYPADQGRLGIFGDPLGLFPVPISDVTVEPLEDADEDVPAAGGNWRRWPRAGYATGSDEVLELNPLARVGDVKRTRTLLPTPVANDVKGDVISHLRNKNGWDGANRNVITSLAVLARNDFQQATPEQIEEAKRTAAETDRARENGWTAAPLLPTPTTQDASNNGGPSQQRRNTPPLNAVVIAWPTPRASRSEQTTYGAAPSHGDTHGKQLQAEVLDVDAADIPLAERSKRGLGLNPEWVEWLMGFPIGWTDPRVDTSDVVFHPWEAGEPEGVPRTSTDSTHRRDRLTALGNALIPAAPAWVAARYLERVTA